MAKAGKNMGILFSSFFIHRHNVNACTYTHNNQSCLVPVFYFRAGLILKQIM